MKLPCMGKSFTFTFHVCRNQYSALKLQLTTEAAALVHSNKALLMSGKRLTRVWKLQFFWDMCKEWLCFRKPRIELACHQHGSASPKGFYCGWFERNFYARRDILAEKHLLTQQICRNQSKFRWWIKMGFSLKKKR